MPVEEILDMDAALEAGLEFEVVADAAPVASGQEVELDFDAYLDMQDGVTTDETADTAEPVATDSTPSPAEIARLALAAKDDLAARAKLQELDPDLAFEFDPIEPEVFTPRLQPGEEAALAAYEEGLALSVNGWDFQQWGEQNPLKLKAFAEMTAWRDAQGLPRNANAAMIRDHALRQVMAEQARKTAAAMDPVAVYRDLASDAKAKGLTDAEIQTIRAAAKGKRGIDAVRAMDRAHERAVLAHERKAANAGAVAKVAAAQERAQRAQAAGQRPTPQGGAGSGSPASTFEQIRDQWVQAVEAGSLSPQLDQQFRAAEAARTRTGREWLPWNR